MLRAPRAGILDYLNNDVLELVGDSRDDPPRPVVVGAVHGGHHTSSSTEYLELDTSTLAADGDAKLDIHFVWSRTELGDDDAQGVEQPHLAV